MLYFFGNIKVVNINYVFINVLWVVFGLEIGLINYIVLVFDKFVFYLNGLCEI